MQETKKLNFTTYCVSYDRQTFIKENKTWQL